MREMQLGITPLHAAVFHGFEEAIEILLYHGADVGAKSAVRYHDAGAPSPVPESWLPACEGPIDDLPRCSRGPGLAR